MTRINLWALVLAILLLPATSLAQGSGGGSGNPFEGMMGGGQQRGSSTPWKEFKLPTKKITFNFRNANPDAIISMLSKESGITIVKDQALKEPLSISSPNPITLDTAFQILSTTVGMMGYEMAKEGNLLVIKKRRENNDRGMDEDAIRRMMEQFGGGNQRGELKVYTIQYANAAEVARVVNEVFAMQEGGNPFQQFFGGGRGGRDRGRGGFSMGSSSNMPTVRASADDYSNSVIVYAPQQQQFAVEELIEQIDKQTEQPQTAKVYMLEYHQASVLAPIVQNVLASNQPTGRGGTSASQNNQGFFQRFQTAARFGSFQSAFGTVVADDRMNALVVTATSENHAMVAAVIADLDKPVELAQSTFVFPLNNAKADDIATLLNNAFGSSGSRGGNTFGNNRFGNSGRFGGGNNNNRGNNNRNNRNSGGFGRDVPDVEDPNALALDFEDEEALQGELMTQIRLGGQFGGGGGTTQQGPVGRTQDGRLVNVRDLSNITVIPDPNTNSLIVVGDPEMAAFVQEILDQLDRIPEQVMIETMIVEATLDESMKLGVEWSNVMSNPLGLNNATGTANQNFGLQTANPALQGFRYTLTGPDYTAFINALKSDDKFQVLSTPSIFTSNNVEAEINISQSIPYVLSTREDNNGNLTFNYAFQDVGIVLTVTPRITSNGYVSLDVVQTANDLQGFTDFNAPIVNQRQAQTTVSVRDGHTIVLGGIMRTVVTSSVKKIPLLGDIPILGEIFKTRDKSQTKTELMVFLTPRVVRDDDDAQNLRQEKESQLSPETQKTIANSKGGKGNSTGATKADKNNKIGN